MRNIVAFQCLMLATSIAVIASLPSSELPVHHLALYAASWMMGTSCGIGVGAWFVERYKVKAHPPK